MSGAQELLVGAQVPSRQTILHPSRRRWSSACRGRRHHRSCRGASAPRCPLPPCWFVSAAGVQRGPRLAPIASSRICCTASRAGTARRRWASAASSLRRCSGCRRRACLCMACILMTYRVNMVKKSGSNPVHNTHTGVHVPRKSIIHRYHLITQIHVDNTGHLLYCV